MRMLLGTNAKVKNCKEYVVESVLCRYFLLPLDVVVFSIRMEKR